MRPFQLRAPQSGLALIPFLVILVLCLAIIAGSLKLSGSSTRNTYAARLRSERFYRAESGVNSALAWLRTNSQYLVSPFTAAEFYSTFERTEPSYGSNDTGIVPVPTKLKLRGTNDSVILSNDASLAAAAFPGTRHIINNSSFNPVRAFAAADWGGALVRVTLVDALPLNPAKDKPPLLAADTDFFPVYRIDAMTGTDRGSHVFGWISGSLFYVDIVGFYGKDYVEIKQDCTSAVFTGANPGPHNAKCPVGSDTRITIANNAEIYGSARSNGTVAPVQNHVCGDYPSCAAQGQVCQGGSCRVPLPPTLRTYEQYCPGGGPDYTVGQNQNKVLNSAGCYNNVVINNKGSLTLTNTEAAYYFRSLSIDGGNAKTQLKVAPSPATETIKLYIGTIAGNTLNGNQTVNPSFKPSQFRIYYLGTEEIKLNGNAAMLFALVASNAAVEVLGNSDFRGGIIAKALKLSGSASVIYDESLGGTQLTDFTSRLRSIEEGYK